MAITSQDAGHLAGDVVPFDVREVPFSYRGAWFDLSPVTGLHEHSDTIHLVSHRNGMHPVLALRPERSGAAAVTTWTADSSALVWRAAPAEDQGSAPVSDRIEAVFDGPTAVRIRGHGLALRVEDAAGGLTPFTGSYLFRDPLDGAPVFTSYETGHRYRITSWSGSCAVRGDAELGVAERAVVLGADGGTWEAVIEEIGTTSAPLERSTDFDGALADSRRTFADFLDAVAPWRSAETPAAALAAYVMWSATVAPAGFTTRESVLMSKHWMDKLWSWDHCFNALALARGLPQVALDQLLAPFDHQADSGALPDSIAHSEVLYNYVKPPIHGWALARLRLTSGRDLTDAELTELYDRLVAWSRFWLRSRRRPGHALPYYQHGNDSGWDNSTTFDRHRVIEGPDLAAFLVLQLEVLAGLAAELGRPGEDGELWQRESDELLAALLEELWTGDRFVARSAHDGTASTATSLLNLLPLVLGDRLPPEIRESLALRVEEHLTEWGPATEPITSPHYEDDGYWRGPIWAPSTALIEDGLRSSGFAELADRVSDRFRRLCERSGFAENFDARTGAGLRDRAYTWTAAVYLTLSADHARRRSSGDPRDDDGSVG